MMSDNQFSPSPEGAEPPHVALFRGMIRTMPPRAFLSQALIVVDRYNIADKLNDGPRSSDELAQMSQTSAHAPYWLLHRLAHVGIFEEVSPHHFANREISRALRSALADSLPQSAVISEHDEVGPGVRLFAYRGVA